MNDEIDEDVPSQEGKPSLPSGAWRGLMFASPFGILAWCLIAYLIYRFLHL